MLKPLLTILKGYKLLVHPCVKTEKHRKCWKADAIVTELSGHQASAGYDAIVTETSTLAVAHAIKKSAGKGKVTHILPLSDEVKGALPSDVEAAFTIVSSAYKPEADEACKSDITFTK